MILKDTIKSLPDSSGVYLMKNKVDKVIYVGKAISIKKRVSSYFTKRSEYISKTDLLVKDIVDIDYIRTTSEAEALILEASLIKTYRPRYNIALMDDKMYPFIEFTGHDFPRISIERPKRKKATSKYYGPYVGVTLVREAMQIIRKIFPFRNCDPFPKKECLDFHIGLCQAPCIGNISKRDYKKNVRNVQLILEGKKDQLYKNLTKEMEGLSSAHKYEEAAKVRDQLRAIGALYSGTKDINYYKEAEQLQRALRLPRVPERIETFDISNLMGEQTVASMVSFFNGKPDKRNYRRFKIKTVKGIDDFKSMNEVVYRRYKRLRDENKMYPDLIVIDGGKGQLSAACEALKKLDVKIPIISLAKREEEIFLPKRRDSIKLSHHLLGLKLLQRTRDEAHRFAIAFHRSLRDKEVFNK
ncbi:MAG: excinuclease ABC subunit C [Lysobacterales bacterium]|jgi:excinuclease ABC subunit C